MDEFDAITLGQLLEHLERFSPDAVWKKGFTNPHSYRGYYECLAFEPKDNVTVAEMLAEARSALGQVFYGYKGGEYVMRENTPVWLASYGNIGVPMVFDGPTVFILPSVPCLSS